MQVADTPKLTSMAAKILDVLVPSLTRTESPAQPMAEKIATISGSNVFGLVSSDEKKSDNPTRQQFATSVTGLESDRTLAQGCSADLVSNSSK
jgi:hypothetical protein